MNYLSTKKIIVILLVVFLVILAFLGYMIWSTKAQTNKVSGLVTELNAKQEKDQSFRSLQALVRVSGDDIATLDSYFVSDDTIVNFLNLIETLGTPGNASSTVTITSVVDQLDVDPPKLEIKVSVQGSWIYVYSFLTALETLPYKITIHSTEFSNSKATNPKTKEISDVWSGMYDFSVLRLKTKDTL